MLGCLCINSGQIIIRGGRDMLHGMGDGRRAHKLFLGNQEGEAYSCRLKIRCEDNIIWDLKEVGYEGDWKRLSLYRVLISLKQ